MDTVKITDASGSVTTSCEYFSVVPGSYSIEWKESSAGMHQYAVGVTLKLKLEKSIDNINMCLPDVTYDMMVQAGSSIPGVESQRDYVNMMLYRNYGVQILDANGNVIDGAIPGIGGALIVCTDFATWNNGAVDKDAVEKLREFLASEPGTEMEFTFGHAAWALDLNQAEKLKEANGIQIVSNSPELYQDFSEITM